MKNVLVLAISISMVILSCKSKDETPKSLCNDPCLKDTIKVISDHALRPYVYFLPANCYADTIVWSHKLLPNDTKIVMSEYTKRDVSAYKEGVDVYFKDTVFAWVIFNDCSTPRGYAMQLFFDKNKGIKNYTSALNKFDPKFNIANGLICYADYNFVYIEDMDSGKKEQVKLSDKELEIDFNEIHKTFDSVHVTRNRAYIKLKGKDVIEKSFSL